MRNGARYIFALSLGLRRGEALGLKWSDISINWKHGCIKNSTCRAKRSGNECPARPGSGTATIRRTLQQRTWQHGCEPSGSCGHRMDGHCPKRHGGGYSLPKRSPGPGVARLAFRTRWPKRWKLTASSSKQLVCRESRTRVSRRPDSRVVKARLACRESPTRVSRKFDSGVAKARLAGWRGRAILGKLILSGLLLFTSPGEDASTDHGRGD